MVHLCSGDVGRQAWIRAGFTDAVQVWRDSPAVGPWSPDGPTRRRLRARFWNTSERALEQDEAGVLQALSEARTVVFWFTPEPWDQMALLFVAVSLFGRSPFPEMSAVPLLHNGPAAAPADLREAFRNRRTLTTADLFEARRVWGLFEAEAWPLLRAWVRERQGGELGSFPHLAPALARVLEDRPPCVPGRTERQVRELMAAGVQDLAGMMRALSPLEDGYGIWYGDRVISGIMRRETGPRGVPATGPKPGARPSS